MHYIYDRINIETSNPKAESETFLETSASKHLIENQYTSLFSNNFYKRISLNDYSPNTIEKTAYEIIQNICQEYYLTINIYAIRVYGSRMTTKYKANSDLDIIIAYTGNEREDDLFNIFNSEKQYIYGMQLDFNPIHPDKSGTLEEYLKSLEK